MESSPFRSVLHTNYAPKEFELQAIKDFCILPIQELAAIEAQIETLRARRSKLKALIDAHQMLLAPIRRIPPEVLQYIFLLCVPQHRNPVMHGSEAPLLLTSICRNWRNLAIETARLWNRIHISIPNVGSESVTQRLNQNCLPLINDWLARSGLEPPLSISLSISPTSSAYGWGRSVEQPKDAPLFGEAIMKYANRWKNIELSFPPWFLDCFRRLTSKDVPMISRFILESRTNGETSWDLRGQHDEDLNFLRSSHTTTLYLDSRFHPIFSQFSGYKLRDLSLHAAREVISSSTNSTHAWTLPSILSKCPHLESFFIYIPRNGLGLDSAGAHGQYITHQNLKILRTVSLTDRFTISLWRHLCLPKLQNLSFSSDERFAGWRIYDQTALCEHLKQFVFRCSPTPSLKQLSVVFDNEVDYIPKLLPFLQECSSVTSLELTLISKASDMRMEQLWSALDTSLHTTTTVLLPNLTSLRVCGHLPESLKESRYLRECIINRMCPPSDDTVRLESFELRFDQTVLTIDVEDAFQNLRELQNLGSRVSITAPNWKRNSIGEYSPFYGVKRGDIWLRQQCLCWIYNYIE